MGCLEWSVLILVAGFVSMIEICAIMICIGKVFDTKMKAKAEIEIKLWEKEMEYIDKVFDKYMTRIEQVIIGKNKKDTET